MNDEIKLCGVCNYACNVNILIDGICDYCIEDKEETNQMNRIILNSLYVLPSVEEPTQYRIAS